MLYILDKVACGNLTDIPSKIPKLTSEVFTIIEIAIPILLVIMGTLDMFKGITASKEDEIAKGRKMFVKRLITAALVFFLFIITKSVVSLIDNKTSYDNITSCMNCFISNDCDTNSGKTFAKTWTCKLGGYEFVFNTDGKATYSTHAQAYYDVDSEFVPRWEKECPYEADYEVTQKATAQGHYEIRIKKK